ncbi:redoxin domain-containing protein [Ammoniphilus sp. CFH 90114]|nr:redoxin domain-containing protein [Ammoniphilus sp. CFH 90114]
MAVRYAEFQSLNCEVLSISVDSILAHKVWDETELSKMVEGGIPYPMLSDQNGQIGKMYDIYETDTGKTKRATFLIDPNGVVQSGEVMNGAVGRNADEILRQLKAYQHYQATKEGTPCGWQVGDPTVKPSMDLAGEVWKEWRPEIPKVERGQNINVQ